MIISGNSWWWNAVKESVPESIPHEKESGKVDDNKGVAKLTKAERRQLLKKTKKEAKKQVKEEPKVSDAKGPLHSEVLVLIWFYYFYPIPWILISQAFW